MKAYRSQRFVRNYRKLPLRLQERIDCRVTLFLRDPTNPLLNNHALHGALNAYRSINAGGDLRIVYREIEQGMAFLVDLGTHTELYGD